MIVVVGREPRILPCVFQAFADRSIRAHGVVLKRGEEASDLFDQMVELEASVLIGVEHLAWCNKPFEPSSEDDDLLEHCLSAAAAPHRPQLVWVTSRPDSDAHLKKLRRSGVPYVIIRVCALYPTHPAEGRHVWEQREILIPSDLPPPVSPIATPVIVGETVARVVEEDQSMGRVLDVGHGGANAWADLIAALGGKPRKVSSLHARAWGFFGRPVLRISTEGVLSTGAR